MAQAFDAAAATAAYLAQLSPAAQAKATAYTQGSHWLLLWGALVTVVVACLLLRLGVLVRLRERIEAAKPRPWLATFVILVVYAVQSTILALPWTIYADWWRNKTYGLTSQPFPDWLSQWSIGLGLGLVQIAIVYSLVYFLIRRAPRTWWLWAGGVTTAFALAFLLISPLVIEPLFNKYTPAPPGPVRDAVAVIAKANGVPADKIFVYNGSRQSNRYTANVSGLLGTARVAMSDVMFQKDADLAEVKAVVGHEMGHYATADVVWLASGLGVLVTLAFFLIDRLFPLAARLAGARGVTGLADPAGYPVFEILFAILVLLGTPLTSSLTRVLESRADQFSLERVNEPDGFARALLKTAEYRAATPSRLEEAVFYDHPSVGARIRRAMEWKASHPPATPPPAP